MKAFVSDYVATAVEQLQALDAEAIGRVGRRFLAAAEGGRQVLVAGNGGSASTASHLACDLAKTVLGSEPHLREPRFRAVSLADNSALLTAWANDHSYDAVFAEQVRMLGREGDLLCVVSVSGNSPSVVEAVRVARANGLDTVALLGSGGVVKDMVDDFVLVPCGDYGHVESVHLVLGHLFTHWLRQELDARSAELAPVSVGRGTTPAGWVG